MRVTILGCGASGGVPLIGCDCAVCASDNPKNKRTRVSILIEVNGLRILVDTPPDIRMQALRHNIQSVDAIIYTHAHADHVHGIDDVRSFNFHKNAAIPVFADAQTLAELQERFAYAFMPP
ncbi:MAG: MBL fold metallo-hydrolase, partial [Rickettsiales bacterium]|nr:MBL fold metallo-hydrolase [Rickettsiales bacterium]